jgi:threonine synthase
MKYISTRGDARNTRGFCDILLEGLAPDGGLYLPEHYPQVDAPRSRAGAAAYADLAFEILSLYIDDIPAADLKRLCDKTYTARPTARWPARDAITPLTTLEPGLSCWNCPTARRWPSRTWPCSCWATCSSTCWSGAASSSTSSAPPPATPAGGRVRDARQAGRARLHAVAARPHEPLPAGADVQPAGRQHPQHRRRGVFDDCQDIVKASATTCLQAQATSIGTVNSINWARVLAQVVYYFKGYFAATAVERRAGGFLPCRRATSATSAPATSPA